MEGYVPITRKGKDFIARQCNRLGNRLLRGESGPLAFTNYIDEQGKQTDFFDPKTDLENGEFVIDATIFGIRLSPTTMPTFLIRAFENYSEMFGLDANYMVALAHIESNFILWAYPRMSRFNSAASGISQFLPSTIHDVVVREIQTPQNTFSLEEKLAICNEVEGRRNADGIILGIEPFNHRTNLGKRNRAQIHMNIINNPQISIKAQCAYISSIAARTDNLASSTLFGYNRGPGYAKPNYLDSMNSAKNDAGYHLEGIDYVNKIFTLMNNNFGYENRLMMSNRVDKVFIPR